MMSGSFMLRCSSAPFFCFGLSSSVATLGRSPRCQFVVDHPSISRRHAKVFVENTGLVLTDLDSLNGTFVDNDRIQTSRVQLGQIVRFGSVPFVVEIKDADEETDPCQNPTDLLFFSRSPTVAQLSKARRRVFDLLVGGQSDKLIARQLRLSPHTVHNHVRAIFREFAVHSRAELMARLLHAQADNNHKT
jgi:DNA-binding CsgD family transcriptional regulator